MTSATVRGERRRPRASRPTAYNNTSLLLFAAPVMLIFAFIVVVPGVQGIVYAFTDWDGLSPSFSFVGFQNIIAVITDPQSQSALINTIVIAISYTVLQNVIGLLLALGVSSRIKSAGLLKVLFFAPVVMTPVVVAFLWQYILGERGPLNIVLRGVGLDALAQPWLGQPNTALASIVLVLIWQFAGYSMVIYLAGLQAVPEEALEAAELDGAGPLRRFWSIKLPLLAPAVTISVMLSLIGSLKVFDQIFVLTGGGPGGSTHTLATLMFREAFYFGDLSGGVAIGVVLLVLVTVISVVQYRVLLRREDVS